MLKKKNWPHTPTPSFKRGFDGVEGGGDLTLWDQNLVLKLQFKKKNCLTIILQALIAFSGRASFCCFTPL